MTPLIVCNSQHQERQVELPHTFYTVRVSIELTRQVVKLPLVHWSKVIAASDT